MGLWDFGSFGVLVLRLQKPWFCLPKAHVCVTKRLYSALYLGVGELLGSKVFELSSRSIINNGYFWMGLWGIGGSVLGFDWWVSQVQC